MYRAAPMLLLALGIAFIANAAPVPDAKDPAKGPTIEEIKKAIEDLGSNRFVVRDKAKKVLAEAGAAAEPLLREAAKNPDEEISTTAKALLDKFQWGLYPDTPKAIRELIEQFRSGGPDERQQAMAQMLGQRPVPFATIKKLLSKEDNEEFRNQMYARLHQEVRTAIPSLLIKGDLDAAEDLFELTLQGPLGANAHDYAAFLVLRDKLDAAITRFEKERNLKDEPGKRANEMLVYLYRNKGDWKAALQAAERTKNDDLIERVHWQSADWKALAASSRTGDLGNGPGMIAAYRRMAGDAKAFREQIDEIRKAAEESMEDRAGLRQLADALLLNGHADDAIKILTDKQKELAFAFDLLCAQMKHKEAFALVDDARRRDNNKLEPKDDDGQRVANRQERNEIEVRRARMLALLGDKDSATQIFRRMVEEEIKGGEQAELARQVVKAEARSGLPELAIEHSAKCMEAIRREAGYGTSLLEPIFGDDKEIALAWWQLFRTDSPNEEAALALKRVRDILQGKLDRQKLDEWIAKMLKNVEKPFDPDQPPPPPFGGRNPRRVLRQYDAVATAYRAVGDEAKTLEYLKKAAEKTPSAERWMAHADYLMNKKKYREAAASYAKAASHSLGLGQGIDINDDGAVVYGQEETGPALPTLLQGKALIAAGDDREGKRLMELAHWLPLGNEIARAKLVDELNKRDLPELARREAEMLLKTGWYGHFSYGNVLSSLARQAAKEKDFFKAADYYEKCVAGCMRQGASFIEPTAYLVVPESIRVYRARGLLGQGKIDEALREANANLEVMPGNIDLAIRMVPELEKAGKKKEADAIYEKVRDTHLKLAKDYSNSAFAHNSVAWIMANCRRQLDDALKHSQKAVELEPKNSGYIDTLAEVWFRRADRDKALTFMKQCVELDPKNGYYKKQLARFKDQPFDSPTPDEEEED